MNFIEVSYNKFLCLVLVRMYLDSELIKLGPIGCWNAFFSVMNVHIVHFWGEARRLCITVGFHTYIQSTRYTRKKNIKLLRARIQLAFAEIFAWHSWFIVASSVTLCQAVPF